VDEEQTLLAFTGYFGLDRRLPFHKIRPFRFIPQRQRSDEFP